MYPPKVSIWLEPIARVCMSVRWSVVMLKRDNFSFRGRGLEEEGTHMQ